MSSAQMMVVDPTPPSPPIEAADHLSLANALETLDRGPGLLVRAAGLMGSVLGRTVQFGARSLHFAPGLQDRLQEVSAAALQQAFNVAILGLADISTETFVQRTVGKSRASRAVVIASGAMGGFLGLGGFVPDVAVTTLAIMREIARVAQAQGEALADADTRHACLQVFALAPTGLGQSEAEWNYLSMRLMLRGKPLVLLLSEAGARYGISLSRKLLLQAAPVIGAIGGAALNEAFLSHYTTVATAHFTVRRLERQYGPAAVELAAINLRSGERI